MHRGVERRARPDHYDDLREQVTQHAASVLMHVAANDPNAFFNARSIATLSHTDGSIPVQDRVEGRPVTHYLSRQSIVRALEILPPDMLPQED